jgi:hypothetical protein
LEVGRECRLVYKLATPRTFAFAVLWPRAHAIRQTVATGLRVCSSFYALMLLRNHADREPSCQLSLVICCRYRDSIVIVVRIADYCRLSWIVSPLGPATVARTTVVVGEKVAFIEPGEWPFFRIIEEKERMARPCFLLDPLFLFLDNASAREGSRVKAVCSSSRYQTLFHSVVIKARVAVYCN